MISVRHLRKEYPQSVPLKDINVDINDGEVISIIGPSGTGKSTFLHCLNRLKTPTSGEIIIDGENILDKKCDIAAVRRKMGMVFQSFNLFEHRTVIENIMMAPMDLLHVDKQTAYDEGMRLLSLVGLDGKALLYPHQLSGGQKQRVAIARTLAMKPKTILFDEPTSALDPTMAGEVLSVMKTLATEGYTMIIVTHEMHFARDVSTRVLLMTDGVIYDDDTPQNIFDNPQKPLTKKFIKRLKSYSVHITPDDFDFISIAEQMTEFGRRLWWCKKQIDRVNRIFEELCMQSLRAVIGECGYIDLEMEYSEADGSIEMIFIYGGKPYNALDGCDELSAALIKGSSTSAEYEYSDSNTITVRL